MRKKHVAVLVMAVSFALGAAAMFYKSGQSTPLSEDDLNHCKLVSLWANGTMSLRQEGFSMAELMDLSIQEADPDLRRIRQNNIQLAYDQLQYHTRAEKERAVLEFENATYRACLKGLKR
ncbi:hypothetical protein [Bordetella bronchiseptica]|nr:hypothetical protein [Bordetella bronchiseptica]